MTKVNVRRGLTRLYLVLWGAWVLFFLVGLPWGIRENDMKQYGSWKVQAAKDLGAGLPEIAQFSENIAEAYKQQTEAASYGAYFHELFEDWPLTLGALVGLPACLYGLLYGSIMTLRGVLRWVVRGFKADVPDQPTHS